MTANRSRIVVNADDLGECPGATEGIIRGHREGLITSASMAVTTPFFQDAVERARSCEKLGIGLHFVLTLGEPAAGARAVPDLVDARGRFNGSFSGLLVRLSLAGNARVLRQIGIELDAQLDRLQATGLRVDHIDSERHVHFIPPIFDLVTKAAATRGIPFVRAVAKTDAVFARPWDLGPLVLHGNLIKAAVLRSLSAINLGDHPAVLTTDHYLSPFYAGHMHVAMDRMLSRPPEGSTELAVHPGLPRLNPPSFFTNHPALRELNSPNRERELNACLRRREDYPHVEFVRFSDLADGRIA